MELTEKEVVVLDRIARNAAVSQRELAKVTGISLGLVNVIVKRFLRTGFVKVSRLNKRQVEYLLTPAGLMAATRKMYKYATNTIRNYKTLQSDLRVLLHRLYGDGYRYFSVHGEGELHELIQSLLPLSFNGAPVFFGSEHRDEANAVVLNITADPLGRDFKGRVVNVLESLGAAQ